MDKQISNNNNLRYLSIYYAKIRKYIKFITLMHNFDISYHMSEFNREVH